MKILITGTAGFIGYHLAKKLLERGDRVVGIDNINDYYDTGLKFARLADTGISGEASEWGREVRSTLYPGYTFYRMNLEDTEGIGTLFEKERFDTVCHLAAQAGVRNSLENPYAYIQSNVTGFFNILEACRQNGTGHLVYASSSSVYGNRKEMPLKTDDFVDHPVSLYAATKKSNELMAYTYSHLFRIATTGLRFFTVYGPWGRPDMAYFLYTKAILERKPIRIFNFGNMSRDFTYIDDITEGIMRVIGQQVNVGAELPDGRSHMGVSYKLYNIGNSSPVPLIDLIGAIENKLGRKAVREYLPMQPGDVMRTEADITDFVRDLGYRPLFSLEEFTL
jgi:UDP-glucuronate 4-epimerase